VCSSRPGSKGREGGGEAAEAGQSGSSPTQRNQRPERGKGLHLHQRGKERVMLNTGKRREEGEGKRIDGFRLSTVCVKGRKTLPNFLPHPLKRGGRRGEGREVEKKAVLFSGESVSYLTLRSPSSGKGKKGGKREERRGELR